MTTKQLSAAVAMAQDSSIRFIGDNNEHLVDITIFDGFGLHDFQPITCTLEQLAALVRWQCGMIGCGTDSHNLQEIALVGRRKFTIVGKGA